jgi:hypothetical protein
MVEQIQALTDRRRRWREITTIRTSSRLTPNFRIIADTEIDKYLALRDCKLAKTPEPIFVLASPRSLSFDRRNQLSASAIQKARLVALAWQALCITQPAN